MAEERARDSKGDLMQDGRLRSRIRFMGVPPFRKSKTRYFWLNLLQDDLLLRVREGETIWEVLEKEDIELGGECGGLGKCGKCKVRVHSSLGPPSPAEEELLDEEDLEHGIRLACRTTVDKDLTIDADSTELDVDYFQILKTGERPLLHPSPLISKHLITLPPELQEEGLSELDRVKLVLASSYQDLWAPLHCLRALRRMLHETAYSGTAVVHENQLLAWETSDRLDCYYGLVYDLGTSTLVGKLINLADGSEVAVASCLNSQMRYGANVISRLQYARDHPNGLDRFHNLLIRDLHRITARLLGAAGLLPEEVFVAVAAGNTTMQHFLLTVDPSGIAEAPFSPVLTDGVVTRAQEVGIELHPEALMYVMPTRSGYIGGDLISVILASGASEQEEDIVLGFDLGTNGEIFLGNSKRLLTCSAAAGPALEGASISHGMIAKAGAIEGAYLEDSEILYQVIGNTKPRGLCGSGLVDLTAVLLHAGVINHEGLIRKSRKGVPRSLSSRIVSRDGVNDFLVVAPEDSYSGRTIYLTQKDIRELQLAKAAIAAGVSILMEEAGIGPEEVSRVYLAGALGNYVDPLSAMRIGLIPDFDPKIVQSLGNAASTGASMVLLSRDYWRMANRLSDFIEHVELSSRFDFDQYFVEHMDFPRRNLW